jgi:hypothetical protein
MSNVSQWNNAAASNNAAAPDGWPEGMPPSGVNDSGREVMAAVSRWHDDLKGITTGGTGNNYTLTTANAHAALGDQGPIVFRADRANTGTATLNVDSLGAKNLEIGGDVTVSGAIVSGSIYLAVYNSTNDTYDLVNTERPSSLYEGTQENIRATDEEAADAASGGEVRGTDDVFRPIGFNVIPDENALDSGAHTYDVDDVGKEISYDSGTARTLNLNNDGNIPVDAVSSYYVGPSAGTLTCQAGTGVTITYWNGSAWTVTAAAGSITIGEGQGIIRKMTDTTYRVNGPNLS